MSFEKFLKTFFYRAPEVAASLHTVAFFIDVKNAAFYVIKKLHLIQSSIIYFITMPPFNAMLSKVLQQMLQDT